MKLTFQQRLVSSFVVVFALFTIGIVVFEGHRVRRYKTEALEERLDAYAGEIARLLEKSPPDRLGELLSIMPPELRVTLVGRDGGVSFDSELSLDSLGDHSGRPEIVAAAAQGHGTSIRTSSSSGKQYLYYARDDGGRAVVRVALPYDIEVRALLEPDNAFLFFVVGLFAVGLVFILWLGNYFGASLKRLREHIAHELRTPVTSIRGFLEIVLGNELDDARRRQYLERAYSQTQTLSALISDMSLLARIDENRGGFQFSPIDARALLDKVRSDTSRGLVEKNIALRADIPEGLEFRGNESLLYSVFRNLTDNVISHAGEGVVIRVTVRAEGHGRARVTFADNGRGISGGEHLERIFERFYRVNEGRTRDTGGSGLGLSIVRNTVALHGGTISVRSNTPSGLVFTFDLPIA